MPGSVTILGMHQRHGIAIMLLECLYADASTGADIPVRRIGVNPQGSLARPLYDLDRKCSPAPYRGIRWRGRLHGVVDDAVPAEHDGEVLVMELGIAPRRCRLADIKSFVDESDKLEVRHAFQVVSDQTPRREKFNCKAIGLRFLDRMPRRAALLLHVN